MQAPDVWSSFQQNDEGLNATLTAKNLTQGQVVLPLNLRKVVCQVSEHFFLRLLLAHHRRHLLSEVSHNHDVNLCSPHALHELVHLQHFRW